METINYTSNFNGKLNNTCFADIRLPFDHISKGTYLHVQLDNVGSLGITRIISVMPIQFKHITDHMAFTVIGQNAAYLRKMLASFYDHVNEETKFVHFIQAFTQRNPDTLFKLLETQHDKLLAGVKQYEQQPQYAEASR